MAERFVIRDLKSGEYLAEKFMRGTYFTNDISQAVKCKTKELILFFVLLTFFSYLCPQTLVKSKRVKK